MNKRHYEHTLPNIRGSLSNTYVTIDIPQGYAVSYLPADFHIETNQGILSCSYRAGAGYIHFRKVMEIRRKRIPLALIPAWNNALRQWKKACNEQIVIRQSTL